MYQLEKSKFGSEEHYILQYITISFVIFQDVLLLSVRVIKNSEQMIDFVLRSFTKYLDISKNNSVYKWSTSVVCSSLRYVKKEKKRKASSTRFDSEKRYKLFDIHGLKQGKKLNFEYLQSGCLKKRLSKTIEFHRLEFYKITDSECRSTKGGPTKYQC